MITIPSRDNCGYFTATAENILAGLKGHAEECIIIWMDDIRWPVSKRQLKDLCQLYKDATLSFQVVQVRDEYNELVDKLCISGDDGGIRFSFSFNFAEDIFTSMAGGSPKYKRLGECKIIGMSLFDYSVKVKEEEKPIEVVMPEPIIEQPKPKRKYTRKPKYVPTWQERVYSWFLRIVPRMAMSFVI